MFTMIGGGMKKLNQSYKAMEDVLPKDALWLKDMVTEIDPKKSQVTTKRGDIVEYDYMVVATGIELDFEKVKEAINTVLCIVTYEVKPLSIL
jgi:sulfide:quinone oxidoreductase